MNNISRFPELTERTSLGYSGLHTLGTNIALIPLGMITSIFIARLLGPGGKGCYDLILATTTLLGVFLGFSLPSGVTYVVARKKEAQRSLGLVLILFALLQGVVALMILKVVKLGGYQKLLLPERIEDQTIMAIAASLIFASFISYWRAMLVGQQQVVQVNRYELATRTVFAVFLLGVVGAVLILGYQVAAIDVVWLGVIVSIFANLIFLRALWPRLRSEGSCTPMRELLLFSLPCYLGNVAQFLNYRLDVFIVNFFVGVEGVGLYVLAVSVVQLIWLISNSAATILLPKVASSEKTSRDNDVITAQMTRVTFWLSCVSGMFLAILANYMIPLFYGELFRGSVTPLLWLLPGVIAFSLVNVLASYIAGIGKPQINLYISLAGLLITVSLNLLLIPSLNILGAAIASTISYSVSAILTIWFFLQQSHLNLKDILFISSEDIDLISSLMDRLHRRIHSKIAG